MSRRKKVRGVTRVAPGTYRVRVRALNPKTRKEVSRFETLEGVTQAQAAARKTEMRAELEAELHGPQGPKRQTLRTYAAEWQDTTLPSLKRSVSERFASLLDLHVLPELGDYYLDELDPPTMRRWRTNCAEKFDRRGRRYSPHTINGWTRGLTTVLEAAAEDKLIEYNPAAVLKPLPDHRPDMEKEGLTRAEAMRLLVAARDHCPEHFPMIALLVLTGMRFGEAASLKWTDIDETEGIIRVRRSVWRGTVTTPKTGKIRTVGLSNALRSDLREHRKALLKEQHPGLADGWVFPTFGKRPKGAPKDAPRPVVLHHPSCLHKPLKKLQALAGIDRHITVQDLRRTHVDVLRDEEVDPAVEHATVGHSSHRMREHYSTVRSNERYLAAEAVARVLVPKRESNGS